MPQTERKANFTRVLTLCDSHHFKGALFNYQPNGFWSESVVALRVSLTKADANRKMSVDAVVCGDFHLDVKISHSIGGESGNLTHMGAYHCFHEALGDAIDLADSLREMAATTSPDDLITHLLSLSKSEWSPSHNELHPSFDNQIVI